MEKTRGQKKLRLRLSAKAYYAFAAVLVVLCVQIFSLTVFFGVSSIEINGVSLYREDQIINVGGADTGENLIRLDTSKIEKRLKENLVYIDEVEITKKYPSTVVISCTEAVKACDILCNDSYYVVSESGRILETKNPHPTGDIPVIEGFELKGKNSGDTLESEDSFKAKILTDIISELKAQDFQGITAIDLTSRTNIVMTYKDRIEMKLGSSVDMDYKLSCFKAVIEERLTDDYEGTLIYNGTESGVSAISKDREDDSSQTDTDSSDISDSSSDETLEDSSAAQTENQWAATTTAPAADAYSTDTTAGAYSTDTANGGYSDTTTTAVEYNNYSTDNQTTTGAYGW